MEPTDLLLGVRTSTAALLTSVADARWTDADVAAATLLPGWTRGHLLTHLARNADSVAGTLAGALRGEIIEQYPGGRDQRAGDIEAGAGRHLAALLADLRESADKLDRVLGALSDADGWRSAAGDERSAGEWLPLRWIEVETHRVDLDHGYDARQWPPQFVTTVLPLIAASLDHRTDEALHVVAEPTGTTASEQTIWTTDGVDATEVRGPDWAVLAWLLGRPSGDSLTATPPLRPWGGVRR